MKIRSGFVSNSSSSSFILDGTKYTEFQIREIIEKMLEVMVITDPDEPKIKSVDDICSIYKQDSAKPFIAEVKSFSYRDETKYLEEITKGKPVIIVDSTSDNSISWPIQRFLEGIAFLRQHWG